MAEPPPTGARAFVDAAIVKALNTGLRFLDTIDPEGAEKTYARIRAEKEALIARSALLEEEIRIKDAYFARIAANKPSKKRKRKRSSKSRPAKKRR